jgi:hypothetical protein
MSLLHARRKLLKLAASLPVSLPVFQVLADNRRADLHIYAVFDQPGQAEARSGAVVLVDSAVKQFQGEGYYVFPDWGKPVVYEVRQKNRMLEFYYPGGDKPLWQMSSGNPQAVFSGRVEGLLSADSDKERVERYMANHNLPALQVPEYSLS